MGLEPFIVIMKELRVIWFKVITIFQSWKNVITIRLFCNFPLQFFFYLILAIFYVFQPPGPTVRPYLYPHVLCGSLFPH
jgi:hypothetical protein